MAATMKDIAERTGLALATISKYLNGGNVREKNRQAIEQSIRELDFTVNAFARGLKTRRSNTIGVVIPELNNLFITTVIAAMEDILRQHGYGVLVCDSRNHAQREQEALQFLLDKMVDGIITMPVSRSAAFLQPALERNIPVVLIDRSLEDAEGRVDMVLIDNFQAALESTRHLLRSGHRQIGIIVGPQEVYTSKQRLLGYNQALIQQEAFPDRGLVEFSDYTVEGGYRSARELFRRNPDMSALFVTNYEMTLGTILAVNEAGIRVPEELSLIGFDNLQLSQIVRPRLTLVAQPLQEIAEHAAKRLLCRLNNPEEPPERILLKAQLLEGESVKKL